MKKLFLTVLLVIFISYGVTTAEDKLEKVVKDLSEQMPVSSVKEKLNIAVIDFEAQPPVSPSEAAFVTEFFRGALVNANVFNVIDKKNMDKTLAEQGFQQTGCTTSECAVKLGKVLNTRQMINGKFGKLAGKYMLTINGIDVETGRIVYSDFQSSYDMDDIHEEIDELAQRYIVGKGRGIRKRKRYLDYFNKTNLISISFFAGPGLEKTTYIPVETVAGFGASIKYVFSRRSCVGLGFLLDLPSVNALFSYLVMDYKFIIRKRVKYYATIGFADNSSDFGSYINLALGLEMFPGKIRKDSICVEVNHLMNYIDVKNGEYVGNNAITYILLRLNFYYALLKQ